MNLLLNCRMDSSLDLIDEAMDFNESSAVDHSEPIDGSTLCGEQSACKVCGDSSTGMYFGAQVCVPCKVKQVNNLCSRLTLIIIINS